MTTTIIEIPADVRDNSETVTDYAFMGHRARDRGVRSPAARDDALEWASFFRYAVHTWQTVNPRSGQRCRFDMLTKHDGTMVHLFHTEYFTRVACLTHDASYASRYVSIVDQDGVATVTSPYCGMCVAHLHRSAQDSGMTVRQSEPLYTGQHD